MRKEIEIKLNPAEVTHVARWKHLAASAMGIPEGKITFIRPLKRSIDARQKVVIFRLKVEVFVEEELPESEKIKPMVLPFVGNSKPVLIAGSGPAGLFAAFTLIRNGLKPIIFERGKEVSARKYDISLLNRGDTLNHDSNYCFGEGGAGTFSDGKLYTRSTKRGNVTDILRTFVEHGASPEILYDAHPHIGTDKLPAIIEAMRHSIEEAGGEFRFQKQVTRLLVQNGQIRGVADQFGHEYEADAVILATGHSAPDVWSMLDEQGLMLLPKPFALGVRIEHPQALIDQIQYRYGGETNRLPDTGADPAMDRIPVRGPWLPAASYNLVTQVEDRGVFSFCMCPGGVIVPAMTGEGEMVVNGMSNSRRNSPWANSGIAVSVEPADWEAFNDRGVFAALAFRQSIEQKAWQLAGGAFKAPAQRMVDFVNDIHSGTLPECSYNPGLTSVDLKEVLPSFITSRLRKAFTEFDQKMKGYLTNEAVLVGVESRTSSPVRIPRDETTLAHPQVRGLYSCGEGAGYAGGIVSSAMDGVMVAGAIR